MADCLALPIVEPSQVAAARRLSVALASRRGFDETEAGKVAIVVTELATNVIKHASGGELLVRGVPQDGMETIEVMALDTGRGIPNVDQCLRDGYSTAGTPGNGLGAIMRLAGLFDIHTVPAVGTAVLVRVFGGKPRAVPSPPPLDIGAVSVPRPGQELCGDGWAAEEQAGGAAIVIVDGLGHGASAAEAATAATQAFRDNAGLAPAARLHCIHGALRSTRGAAVAVAEVDPDHGTLRFCGVGNISGTVLSDQGPRKMVSQNGTVGHEMRKVSEFTYPWPENALLVLHSDGLSTHWSLDGYPGLSRRRPSLIAGVLYRDFKRGRDDVTVVVAKGGKPEA
ncbi:MAG TPA: ATP-binding SpoIIE family protein phosphatase [Methylomirabilota bacterium]|nr:ATP-binding SpoIIE family protein phosphatase [Methylomirabilota bacterium]